MSMRKAATGASGGVRPSGTDGSDFSYRMVVDSRYTKVAKGKSRLSAVILTQAIIQILSAVVLYLSMPKGEALDRLSVSSSIVGFVSLLLGELGRKRSRVILLKLYMFGSSVGSLMSVVCFIRSENSVQMIKGLSKGETSTVELFNIATVSLGLLVQVFASVVTTSLIHNMAPPKRAS